jgi:hypothetical protein
LGHALGYSPKNTCVGSGYGYFSIVLAYLFSGTGIQRQPTQLSASS